VPVAVVGGPRFIARPVAAAMSRVSPEVRVLTRDRADAEELRAAGAKVAVGSSSDPDLLDAVLAGAHTLCLLDPGADGTTAMILDRARAARVRRVIATAHVGAPTDMIEGFGIPHGVVRVGFVCGPGSPLLELMAAMARTRSAGRAFGPGTRRWAPVFVDDLAEVLARADDRAQLGSGTWGLDGPDVVTVNELVDILAGRRRRIRSSAGRPRTGDAELDDLVSRDLVAGPPSAAEEFGVGLTPLREGLARSLP
jgi:uncharacterized protein YbjT (DUF2867 family)